MDYIVLDMEWNQPWPGSPSAKKVLPVQIRGAMVFNATVFPPIFAPVITVAPFTDRVIGVKVLLFFRKLSATEGLVAFIISNEVSEIIGKMQSSKTHKKAF